MDHHRWTGHVSHWASEVPGGCPVGLGDPHERFGESLGSRPERAHSQREAREVRTTEVGSLKVCAFEPGLAEVCVLEAGAAETGTREIGPLKVCFLEILAAQFGPGDFLSLRSARHCSRPSDSSQIWCIASTGARDWVL